MAAAGGDAAQRDRIISHMNQGHARELTHYLRHYCSLTRSQAAGASLRDITLQGMRIRAGGVDYMVDFKPPLSSYKDARPRVVEMDAAARAALGISDVLMDKYHVPDPFALVPMVGLGFYFACYFGLSWVVPGTRIWNLLAACFPGGPTTFRWLVEVLLVPVIAIHVLECLYLDLSRLQRHGVDRWSGQWWMWTVNCLFEGFSVFMRFDGVIEAKRAQKAAKKH